MYAWNYNNSIGYFRNEQIVLYIEIMTEGVLSSKARTAYIESMITLSLRSVVYSQAHNLSFKPKDNVIYLAHSLTFSF